MKLKHILLALFVVLLCVVTINTANKAEAVTAGTLSVELGDYNESNGVHHIKFTLTGGGTVNYLWITGETSSYSNYYTINANSSITWTPSQAGEYYAIVNCTDGSGAANSNRVDFHVGRPTGVTMKVNGTTSGQKFAVNATIPFTFTSDNPNDNGFIYVYKADGTEYKHWNIYTTRSSSTTISDPGNYTAIVQLWNSTHWTKSASVSFTVYGGSLSVTSFADTSSSNGKTVQGTIKYTISIKNNANCKVNLNFAVTYANGKNLYSVSNGTATNGTGTTASVTGNLKELAAGGTVTIVLSVNTNDSGFTNTTYTVNLGTVSGAMVGLSSGSGSVSGSTTTSYTFKPARGSVSLDWSASHNGLIWGEYTYTVTFTNKTNHPITGIDYTIKIGDTKIVTVSDGAVKAEQAYVSVNKTALGEVSNAAGSNTVTLVVTIDTTQMGTKKDYTFTLSNGTCTSTGVVNNYNLTATAGKTHSIKVPGGSVVTTLTADGINNNGVGEGTVNYTITLKNDTNYTLKGITFAVKDSAGNALFTVNNDGTIAVHNSALVKNANSSALTVSGSLTGLTAGSTVTITGIQIDADADALDAAGQLVMTATGSAQSSNVEVTALSPSDASDIFTIMVRHDVNVLVQAGKDTTITADVIRKAMRKSAATAYNNIPETITGVKITDINGNEITNANISVDGTGLKFTGLTAEYTEFIIEVSYDGGKILVPMQVTTLASGQDRVFVLNYSLPVTVPVSELLADLRSTGGAYASTTFAAIGFDNDFIDEAVAPFTGTFGNFDFTAENVKYTNAKIMTDGDAVYLVIRVTDGTGEVENVDYVDLYKQITIIPGNVIYYEDNNESVKYPTVNDIVILGEVNQVSTSVSLPLIPGDNTFNDGAYKDDVEYSGLGVHKVPVHDQQVTVKFSFTGTGFELLSRVNGADSATLLVKVSPAGQDNWTWYPVITRFEPNGVKTAEVYQTPVFRLNNGEYGAYDVEVVGLPNQTFDDQGKVLTTTDCYIYIDGIRVYNPLGTSDLTNNYGDEKDAEFTNLRDLILNGQGLVVKSENGKTSGFTTGNFFYVPDDKGNFTAALGGINELGAIGANNEILIRQSAGDSMIVLYVNGDGLLQIGIHDVHDDKFDGGNGNNVPTTVKILNVVNGNNEWVDLATGIQHGAELYYNIDLSNCPEENGNKVVMLRVESGFASFTNVKHKGVTFEAVGTPALDAYVNPGYYFNANGDMCFINEDGEEEVKIPAAELTNMGVVNNMLAETEPEEEIIE